MALTKFGDMTYYNLGMTASGKIYTDSDNVVAIAFGYWTTPNPNLDPIIGKKIKVKEPKSGKETIVSVVDKCGGCSMNDVDMSPTAFQRLAPLEKGRVKVQWDFIEGGGGHSTAVQGGGQHPAAQGGGQAIDVRGGGQTHVQGGVDKYGDMTYFHAGLTASGKINKDSDMVAGIGHDYWTTPNPKDDPIIGKKIKVREPISGKEVIVTVIDKCSSCGLNNVNLSPAAFQLLAPLEKGRVKVQWGFVDGGGESKESCPEKQGDMTYFHAGLTASGQINKDSDMVAGIGHDYWTTANPNYDPIIGKKINVREPISGKEVIVSVIDKCSSCGLNNINLSPAAFQQLVPLEIGRIRVSWKFVDGCDESQKVVSQEGCMDKHGDMTYFYAGLTASGQTNKDSDMVAGIGHDYWTTPNPNYDPIIGKKIRVREHVSGKEVIVSVIDKCSSCGLNNVNLTPTAFQQLAPLERGRVQVSWGFVEENGECKNVNHADCLDKYGESRYFYGGLTASGKVNKDSDMVAAVGPGYWTTSNPNVDPIIGRKVKVIEPTSNKSIVASIVDKCDGCTLNDVNLSPTAFQQLAPLAKGVIKVKWGFVEENGECKGASLGEPGASSGHPERNAVVDQPKNGVQGGCKRYLQPPWLWILTWMILWILTNANA